MSKRYSIGTQRLMRAVRETAKTNPAAICWWCGERPHNNRWAADHVFPLLGEFGPVVAVCAFCNRTKRRRLASVDQCRRLYHSDDVVRSCGKVKLQNIAKEETSRLFKSTAWITTLMAADNTYKPQKIRRSRGGVAVAETNKLLEMLKEHYYAPVQKED